MRFSALALAFLLAGCFADPRPFRGAFPDPAAVEAYKARALAANRCRPYVRAQDPVTFPELFPEPLYVCGRAR